LWAETQTYKQLRHKKNELSGNSDTESSFRELDEDGNDIGKVIPVLN
jgi:hypothetical protein